VAAGTVGGGNPSGQLPRYFARLSARAQRIYLQSDAIDRYAFAATPAAVELANRLIAVLEGGAPSIVQRSAQALLDEMSQRLGLRGVQLEVRSVRPHDARGELHGIFYPRERRIVLWMRTAQRHDIVKPRTFLRTLMHEYAHYLDYALLRLGDSPHSSGFFKRESFLMRSLTEAAPESGDR
jgi:hypothetical protein